jgi:hypothetical protein
MEIGLDHGLILHGASLPEGLDPDELLFDQESGQPLPEGKERMATLLGASQPLLATRLAEESKLATSGPEARTQALKRVADWLKRYTDPVGREVWIEDALRSLGVSRPLLAQAMGVQLGGHPRPNQGQNLNPNPNQKSASAGPPRPQGAPTAPAGPPRSPQARRHDAQRVQRLHPSEKTLLQGLAMGGEFSQAIVDARAKLPPESTLADLFDYPPARDFVAQLANEAGALERLRAAPASLLTDDLEPQVRSTLTEAMVSREPLFDRADFGHALDRAIGRLWARFSQRIKAALADAEAKQDAGLQEQLAKEYLDVQRKIKEFISFYDEA